MNMVVDIRRGTGCMGICNNELPASRAECGYSSTIIIDRQPALKHSMHSYYSQVSLYDYSFMHRSLPPFTSGSHPVRKISLYTDER